MTGGRKGSPRICELHGRRGRSTFHVRNLGASEARGASPWKGTPITAAGEESAEPVRREFGACPQLLTVISGATNTSWRPQGIGVAAEKHFPLATCADRSTKVPESLSRSKREASPSRRARLVNAQ